MRILHTNMLRGWGGQSNRILTEALGTRRAGHDVAFAVPHVSPLNEKGAEGGIEILPDYEFKPPAKLNYSIPDLRRLLRDIRNWKPDLIHIHGSQDTWLVVIAKQILGKKCPPLIRSKHNDFPWNTHALNRWLYNQIDAYITISSFIDKQVVDYPGLAKKPRRQISSVPNLARIEKDHPPVRQDIEGLTDGMFLWGCTARLRPEKAHDVLLPAFAKVREKRDDAYLVIAGAGSEREKLEQLADDLGLTKECLQFLGFQQDVPALLNALDGYVLASRLEGLGTSILEALATGLPVVASNVGGIPDSVHHEENGLLCEPENPDSFADAMLRVMEDDEFRKKISRNAWRTVREEFSEERLVEKTLDFYEEVLNRK